MVAAWVSREESGLGRDELLRGFSKMVWVGVRVIAPWGALKGCRGFPRGKIMGCHQPLDVGNDKETISRVYLYTDVA